MRLSPGDSERTTSEPTETSELPIRTRSLGHVTGYQPIRDQYFLIRSVPETDTSLNEEGKTKNIDLECVLRSCSLHFNAPNTKIPMIDSHIKLSHIVAVNSVVSCLAAPTQSERTKERLSREERWRAKDGERESEQKERGTGKVFFFFFYFFRDLSASLVSPKARMGAFVKLRNFRCPLLAPDVLRSTPGHPGHTPTREYGGASQFLVHIEYCPEHIEYFRSSFILWCRSLPIPLAAKQYPSAGLCPIMISLSSSLNLFCSNPGCGETGSSAACLAPPTPSERTVNQMGDSAAIITGFNIAALITFNGAGEETQDNVCVCHTLTVHRATSRPHVAAPGLRPGVKRRVSYETSLCDYFLSWQKKKKPSKNQTSLVDNRGLSN
eukprot:sb/3465661/